MKLFVTGGAGFIGSNFIRYWLDHHPEDQIVNFDLLTYAGNLANLKDIENNINYTFVKGDIRDKNQVRESLAGCDIVVHFAAETHVDRSIEGPENFVTTNVLGTQNLLEQSRLANIKHFHHISTDEVYGSLELNSSEKFTETTRISPNSPYSASKAGADFFVRAYFKTYGLPVTITNTSNNYGPYQFPEKFIPTLITRGLLGKSLPLYGEGKNVRDWIHVEDHCSAIEAVIEKGVIGEVYLVGGGNEYANIDIVKKICKILDIPEDRIEYVADRPGHDLRYAINDVKIRSTLNWAPKYDFDSGLGETVKWYKENQSWWETLINDRPKRDVK